MSAAAVPAISPLLLNWFTRYTRWYLRRNFNAIRIANDGLPPTIPDDRPMIIVLNHPSWWDPLICLLLANHFWPARKHFAPIDATALAGYPILSRLGFFGIEKNSGRGAATWLRTGSAILQQPNATIWSTVEGEFTDPRDCSRPIHDGAARLAERTGAAVIPLAIEYPFWQERRPEALCRFGGVGENLRDVQQQLAVAAIGRDPMRFQSLLEGRSGVNGFYDLWRRASAMVRGRSFSAKHEAIRS